MAGYIYLGSPYSHPDAIVREARYLAAAEALMTLLKNKLWTYSPIVHCHELSKTWGMPSDAAFWEEYDFAMLDGAHSMTVLTIRGWQESKGLSGEINRAISRGKQLTYLSGVTDVEAFCRGYTDQRNSSAS